MIGYRHAPPGYPFLWESSYQPAARWHGAGDGPVQYLADTVDGAWAEFLRHEEIVEPEDLAGVRRAMWAVNLRDLPRAEGVIDADRLVSFDTQTGGLSSYPECQAAASRARAGGATMLFAHSAALERGRAHGFRVDGGLIEDAPLDGGVVVVFGKRPDLVGWELCAEGRPGVRVLVHTRPL